MAFSLLNNSLLLNKPYLIILDKSVTSSLLTLIQISSTVNFHLIKKKIESDQVLIYNYNYGNSCSLQPFIGESVSSSMAYNDNSNRPLYVLKLKIFKVFNIYRSSNTYKTWRKLIFKTGQGSGFTISPETKRCDELRKSTKY